MWWVVLVSEGSQDEREAIRTLISRSGRNLDNHAFEDFINLFALDGTYSLEAQSQELGMQMTWLSVPRDELSALLEESPQHVHDLAARTHQITVDEIDLTGETAEAQSTFSVFRTDQSGVTQVYAVGHYHDRLTRNSDGGWVLQDRRTLVTTRMFRTPTPMPL